MASDPRMMSGSGWHPDLLWGPDGPPQYAFDSALSIQRIGSGQIVRVTATETELLNGIDDEAYIKRYLLEKLFNIILKEDFVEYTKTVDQRTGGYVYTARCLMNVKDEVNIARKVLDVPKF
jgi:hypothetical protein